MNLTPIVFFALTMVILSILVYRIVKSKPDSENSKEERVSNNTPGGIINLEIKDYKGQKIQQVFYSTINNFEINKNIHSIENGLFLKFENGTWVSIMFNSNMDIYQLESLNPNKIALEYQLNEMTLSLFWKQVIGQTLTNLSITFEKERGFDLPKDLILNFENNQVAIFFSEKMLESNKIIFGQEWLYLILGEAELNRTRI